jgi:carbon storage regulator
MLVVSRKKGEDIVVPEFDIVFTILEVRGDRVRVGISAPSDVQVHRREIWQRIVAQTAGNTALALSSPPPRPRAVVNGLAAH